MSKEINFGPLNKSDPEALGKIMTTVLMTGSSEFNLTLATGLKVIMDEILNDGNRLLLLKGELDGMGKNALNICPDVLWYKKEWV
jgi:hypothetical protein